MMMVTTMTITRGLLTDSFNTHTSDLFLSSALPLEVQAPTRRVGSHSKNFISKIKPCSSLCFRLRCSKPLLREKLVQRKRRVHLLQPPRDPSPCHPACGGSQSSIFWMRSGWKEMKRELLHMWDWWKKRTFLSWKLLHFIHLRLSLSLSATKRPTVIVCAAPEKYSCAILSFQKLQEYLALMRLQWIKANCLTLKAKSSPKTDVSLTWI